MKQVFEKYKAGVVGFFLILAFSVSLIINIYTLLNLVEKDNSYSLEAYSTETKAPVPPDLITKFPVAREMLECKNNAEEEYPNISVNGKTFSLDEVKEICSHTPGEWIINYSYNRELTEIKIKNKGNVAVENAMLMNGSKINDKILIARDEYPSQFELVEIEDNKISLGNIYQGETVYVRIWGTRTFFSPWFISHKEGKFNIPRKVLVDEYWRDFSVTWKQKLKDIAYSTLLFILAAILLVWYFFRRKNTA